jgi:putative salt-induced outer membrane protein YdiY
MKQILLLAVFAFIPFVAAFADQIVMKNGDHLTGQILRSDGKTLLLKTDYAGKISLKWPEIEAIVSTQPLSVRFEDGTTASGKITTEGADVVVAIPTSTLLTMPWQKIASLRNADEEAAYQKSLHPGLLHEWKGTITTGFTLTRGNSSTRSLNFAFKGARKTRKDKISLYASSIYTTNDEPGATPSTTANAETGGGRYDRNFDTHLFAFGSGDFQADELQSLDLRSVLGGGLGYHWLRGSSLTLDLLGGVNYTRENYSTYTNNFPAGIVGEELQYKFLSHSEINQHFQFYPDFVHSGQYRITFNVAEVSKLNSWLGWQTSLSDIYVTNPPAGKQRNDLVLTTGLNVSFSD